MKVAFSKNKNKIKTFLCQVIDILDKSVIHSPWCCQSQDQDGECEEKEKSASRPHHQIDYVLQPNSILFLIIVGKQMLIIFGFWAHSCNRLQGGLNLWLVGSMEFGVRVGLNMLIQRDMIMMVLVNIIVLSTGIVIWMNSIPSNPARPKRDICYFYNQGSDLLSNSQQENKTKIYWGCNPVTLADHLGFNLS